MVLAPTLHFSDKISSDSDAATRKRTIIGIDLSSPLPPFLFLVLVDFVVDT